MTPHHMTPPGRISAKMIDALLDQTAPDDWLAEALIVPLQVGLLACAVAFIALTVQFVQPTWLPAAMALWAILGLRLPFSVTHMIRLGRIRRCESLTWRDRAQ